MKGPTQLCRPGSGPIGNLFVSAFAAGISGHVGVSAGGCTHDFGLHGGDLCSDFVDSCVGLFFKLGVKCTFCDPAYSHLESCVASSGA